MSSCGVWVAFSLEYALYQKGILIAMHVVIDRLVATSANGVKVSVALDCDSAAKLVQAGFPARFTAWGAADKLVIGKAFESFLVLGVRPERDGKDKEGNAVTYAAETELRLV